MGDEEQQIELVCAAIARPSNKSRNRNSACPKIKPTRIPETWLLLLKRRFGGLQFIGPLGMDELLLERSDDLRGSSWGPGDPVDGAPGDGLELPLERRVQGSDPPPACLPCFHEHAL